MATPRALKLHTLAYEDGGRSEVVPCLELDVAAGEDAGTMASAISGAAFEGCCASWLQKLAAQAGCAGCLRKLLAQTCCAAVLRIAVLQCRGALVLQEREAVLVG